MKEFLLTTCLAVMGSGLYAQTTQAGFAGKITDENSVGYRELRSRLAMNRQVLQQNIYQCQW